MTTFISYSRVNSDFAVNIAKDLRSAGFDIWLDQLDIPTGSRWDDELEKALDRCSTFLIVLSPESIKSQNVKDEIGYAIDGGKHILPVLIKNCKIPLRLRRFQFVDFTDDSYKESLDQIKQMLGNTSELQKGDKASDKVEDESALVKSLLKWKPQLPYIVGGIVVIALAFLFIGRFMAAGSTPAGDVTITPAQTSTLIPATETITSVPTESATPPEPTSTLVPATDTPVPTFTPIPTVEIGQDWIIGCVSSKWQIYPSSPTVERGDGCWVEPVINTFSAENGDLDFLAERGSGDAEIYGLFARLPESGTVTFTVRLKDLDNADLLMGVFPEPDVASQGLLMTILNGDVNKRSIDQKDPLTYVTVNRTSALNQGNGFSVSFTFTTLSATSRVNPSVFTTNQVSIRSPQKWLFLGFKGLRGQYRIEGTFLNFDLR